jgi:hypothetical protein
MDDHGFRPNSRIKICHHLRIPVPWPPFEFTDGVKITLLATYTYESTKLLHRGVNDYGLEVSITFKHFRLVDLLMD